MARQCTRNYAVEVQGGGAEGNAGEHDEGCMWQQVLCCWCPRCLRGVLRGVPGCKCCRHPGCWCGGGSGQNIVPADDALSEALLQQQHGNGSGRSAGGDTVERLLHYGIAYCSTPVRIGVGRVTGGYTIDSKHVF